jgi:adenosylmethionine-8-amino-7-oxononanoate aminotransferase
MKEVQITHGEGVTLYDKDGNTYLDAVSGTFNVVLGYTHPKVVSAIAAQVQRVSHVSSHHTKPHVRTLFDKLFAHAPEGITRGWLRDITGSTANEGAIKMAQKGHWKEGHHHPLPFPSRTNILDDCCIGQRIPQRWFPRKCVTQQPESPRPDVPELFL